MKVINVSFMKKFTEINGYQLLVCLHIEHKDNRLNQVNKNYFMIYLVIGSLHFVGTIRSGHH